MFASLTILEAAALLALTVIAGTPHASGKPTLPFQPFGVQVKFRQYDELLNVNNDDPAVDGDVLLPVHRASVTDRSQLWDNGTVPFALDKQYSSDLVDILLMAMEEIRVSTGNSTHPCVQFIPWTTEETYLVIQSGETCTSTIGHDGTGPSPTTLGIRCFEKGLLIHELLHTLGIFHEQDRYDRDSYVDVNYGNMLDSGLRNFQLRNDSMIDLLGTPYNFQSIMHYSPYSFAKDMQFPTMSPKPEYADVWIGQRLGLSDLDVLGIQRLYGCPEDTSHIVSKLKKEHWLAWCDFGNGTCDFVTDSNTTNDDASGQDTFSWVVMSSPTPDGPNAGKTNGLDPFLYASKQLFNLDDAGQFTLNNAANATTTNTTVDVFDTNATLPSPTLTASIKTPLFISDEDNLCIQFDIVQPKADSFLSINIMGPSIPSTPMHQFEGNPINSFWGKVHLSFILPSNVEVQLEFVATVRDGCVAVDNIIVLKGICN